MSVLPVELFLAQPLVKELKKLLFPQTAAASIEVNEAATPAGRPAATLKAVGLNPGLCLNHPGSHKKSWCQACPRPLKSEWWKRTVMGPLGSVPLDSNMQPT